MQSEGPYFIADIFDHASGARWFMVKGPGIKYPRKTATSDREEAIVSVKIRNSAYAEGQKVEREKLHREIMGDTNEPRQSK